jgi:hypothetical protein
MNFNVGEERLSLPASFRWISLFEVILGVFLVLGRNVFRVVPNEVFFLFALPMLHESSIGKALLQVLGVAAYFALIVILYWRGLTNVGAVGIIIGLLFFFKTVVDSGAISLAQLVLSEPEFKIASPGVELSKALSFFGIGMGAWIDLTEAMEISLVPATLPTAVIHLMLVCVFAICVTCCFARFTVALKNRPRR